MLISRGMNDLMNSQVGNEFAASLQYVSIASYFHEVGLPVLSEHFFKQAEEERAHALKFALDWERSVTKQINGLLDKASSERDYLAHDLLEWFAREQLEECSSMDTLLKMVRRAGESGLVTVENALASGRTLSFGGRAGEAS